MVLWWIGNVILLVVVLPVVIYLLTRVLAAVERIRAAADNVLAGGVALIGELNGLPEALAVTDETVKEVSVGAVRYAGSVAKLLGGEKETGHASCRLVHTDRRRADHRHHRGRPATGHLPPQGDTRDAGGHHRR